jgi:hypothetical protein
LPFFPFILVLSLFHPLLTIQYKNEERLFLIVKYDESHPPLLKYI